MKFTKIEPAKVHAAYLVRLTLDNELLGTKPCVADLNQQFIQTRMNKADRMSRELTREDRIAKANEDVESAEKALNILYKRPAKALLEKGETPETVEEVDGKVRITTRGGLVYDYDPDTEIPLISGYQILGYLKEASITQSNDKTKLASQFFAGSLKGKVEAAFNVPDYFINVFLPKGADPYETVTDADGKETKRWKQFSRPLRSDVRGIQQTSITTSEVVPAGSVLEFVLEARAETIPVSSGKQAAKVDAHDFLVELLGEGIRRGLGSWRNGAFGRFTAEIAEL